MIESVNVLVVRFDKPVYLFITGFCSAILGHTKHVMKVVYHRVHGAWRVFEPTISDSDQSLLKPEFKCLLNRSCFSINFVFEAVVVGGAEVICADGMEHIAGIRRSLRAWLRIADLRKLADNRA